MPTYTVFLGNPGTGKSCFSNAIMGEARFKSGVSYGRGLTHEFQLERLLDGNYVGDCPGLDDPEIRIKAAKEITKLLKSNEGDYKLVFVVTLESGRVRAVDVATIKLVLNAISKGVKDLHYGIIVNKNSHRMMEELRNPSSTAFRRVVNGLNLGGYRTMYVTPYPRMEALEDQQDVVHVPTEELTFFLATLPSVHIKPGMVEEVKASEFDAISEELKSEIKDIEEDHGRMEMEMNQNERTFKKQLDELRKTCHTKIEEMSADQKKTLNDKAETHKEKIAAAHKELLKSLDDAHNEIASVRRSESRDGFFTMVKMALGAGLAMTVPELALPVLSFLLTGED